MSEQNIVRLTERIRRLLDESGANDTHVSIEKTDLEECLQNLLEAGQAETQLREILEAAPDAIVGVNRDGRIIMMNGQTERLFGYSREELSGQPVEMLMPESFRAIHIRHRKAYMQAPHARPMGRGLDLLGRRKGGHEFSVEISLSPLETDAGPIVISIIRDNTYQKDLENRLRQHAVALEEQVLQAERLAVVGRMAAQVAHEIRNPLSSIGLNIELLADEIQDQDQQAGEHDEANELIRITLSEIERLNNVLDDYLQFARMPSKQVKDISMNSLVDELVKFVRPEADQRHVRLKRHLAQELPSVRVDPALMRRAILNCVRNAIEAMPDGGVLTLSTRSHEGQIELSVSDTGSGIHIDYHTKVFDPFYSTKDKGTGLGLPYVRQIVTEHGGEVLLQSEPGAGTTVTIRLPVPDNMARRRPCYT